MILVTGGAGFLGQHLVRLLAARGERVRVLDLPSALRAAGPNAGPNGGQVEATAGDVRDRRTVAAALRGCRQVVHLAANPHLWTRRRADYEEINHRGTEIVLAEALAAGAERILHVSTESILAMRPAGADPERCRLRSEDVRGLYCESKLRAEQAAWRHADAGAPVLVAAPTLPVGPGDGHRTPPTKLAVDFLQGKVPALLDAEANLVDARDVAAGLAAALDRGMPGRRYLVGGHNVRLSEWLSLLGAETGRAAPRWRVPYCAALAIAAASEAWAQLVSRSAPQATLVGVRLAGRGMRLDCRRTDADLGLTARPLAESARDAVADFRARGWLP